jgi:hypothetical protein
VRLTLYAEEGECGCEATARETVGSQCAGSIEGVSVYEESEDAGEDEESPRDVRNVHTSAPRRLTRSQRTPSRR